jgi:DNA polymerase-3 subunit delta'
VPEPAAEPLLRGHDAVLEGLWRATERGRLPHALLFQGPAGVGKFRAAQRFAAGLLCERGPGAPCGACGACRRRLAGSHGGLYVLDPGALQLETIPIHYVTPRDDHRDVHTIEEFLALRAADGGWRVVVLRDFDRAGTNTQNALLKTLEEPGRGVVLVLESSRPDLLLETIRSRCVPVAFELLPPEDAAAVLTDAGLATERAALLSRWCEGAPGRALQMDREAAPEMRAALEALLTGGIDGLEAAARLTAVDGAFEGKSALAAARARARPALDLALAVGRDLARRAAGVPAEALPHGDLAARVVVPEAGRPTPGAIAAAVDALARARQDVDLNLDPAAILDRAMLALERLARSARALPRSPARSHTGSHD